MKRFELQQPTGLVAEHADVQLMIVNRIGDTGDYGMTQVIDLTSEELADLYQLLKPYFEDLPDLSND